MWDWSKIEYLISLIIGVLLILFRKEFANLVIWYHLRRWCKRKNVQVKQYPEKAWSAGKYFVQVFAVIIGLIFSVMSLLALLGILKEKP